LPENYQYDLYVTKPYESTRRAEKIPNMMLITTQLRETRKRKVATARKQDINFTVSSRKHPFQRKDQPVDPDIKSLQDSLAAAEASRSQ